MSIATGQITIIDYNDALTLVGFIQSSQPKTQQYNPDTGIYTPSWDTSTTPAGTNLVLTPQLFKLGDGNDQMSSAAVTSLQWYEVVNGVETAINGTSTNYTAATAGTKSPLTLTVKKNVLGGVVAKDFTCVVVYHDASTGLDLTYKIGISFNKVINGGGIADAVAWCPTTNIFKNGSPSTITAHCDLWRGSVVDTTLITYQWYQQDPSITSASPYYDAGAGAGWRKLSDTANTYTGTTTADLVVYPSAVNSAGVFKCQIKDVDSASGTYNQYFYDTVTIIDQSDPIQLTIVSSGGDVFKNGVGSTTLTAKCYRAGQDITANYVAADFKWYKYNKDGTLVTGWGGATDYKTGKTLAVGDADVDVKATFVCELK